MSTNKEIVIVWLLSAGERELPIAEDRLRQIVSDVRMFTQSQECADCILSLHDETVFLVLGRGRVETIYSVLHCGWITCIYLLEHNKNAPTLSNIRGSFIDLAVLLEQLQCDVDTFQGNHTHLTFCSPNEETSTQMIQQNLPRFFWSQILLDAILGLQITKPSENAFKDLLHECRLCYCLNATELAKIDDFERNYTPETAIRWYTRDTFVYKLLNKSLRTQNIIVIFKFRTLIQDMYRQLKCEHITQMTQPDSFQSLKVYRGQKVAFHELDNIKANVGRLISLNTFFSTTADRQFAEVMSGLGVDPLFASIVFEMCIDRVNAQSHLPFADISHLSQIPEEREVLLCMGTVLRLEAVNRDNATGITWIRLTLCAYENTRLTKLKESLFLDCYTQPVHESYLILSLSRILTQMGEFDKANRFMHIAKEKYKQEDEPNIIFDATYETLKFMNDITYGRMIDPTFSQLTTQVERMSQMAGAPLPIQTALQTTQSLLTGFQPSIQSNGDPLFDYLLPGMQKIMESLGPLGNLLHQFCPQSFFHDMMLAEQYSSQGDHARALSVYEELLKKQQDIPVLNEHRCVGILYNMAIEAEKTNNEEKIIDYNLQLLGMRDVLSTMDVSTHLHANQALATLFEKRKEPESALQFHENIINMVHLPPDHGYRINAFDSSAHIYAQFGDFTRALTYRQRAFELNQRHDPSFNVKLAQSNYHDILFSDPFLETAGDAARQGNDEAEKNIYMQCLNTTNSVPEYDRRRRICVYERLAQSMERRQDKRAALQYYEHVINLTSNSATESDRVHLFAATEKCASLNEKLGDLTSALTFQRQLLDLWQQRHPDKDNCFVRQHIECLENRIKQKNK